MNPTCPGCLRPVTRAPVRCPHCQTSYHAECRDPVLGCVVAGCTAVRVRASSTRGWSLAWRIVRFTSLYVACASLTLNAGLRYGAAQYLGGSLLLAVPALTLAVWFGCIQDFRGRRTAGRLWGSKGLLWVSSGIIFAFGTALVSAVGLRRPPLNLVTWTGGASALIGALHGLAGLFADTDKTRGVFALLTGGFIAFLFAVVR